MNRKARASRAALNTSQRLGVSLIELLLVAAVLVLLLGLAVPLFRGMRVRHDDLQNITNLGASAKDFAIYAADHDGRSVNAGLPEQTAGNWFYEVVPGMDPVWRYRNHASEWPSILHESGFDPSPHWQATAALGNGQPRSIVDEQTPYVRYVQFGTNYKYPDPMWTEAWVWTDPGIGPLVTEEYAAFYKRVRLDEVVAPARKGLLVYEESLNDDATRVSVAFVDGHAARLARADATPTAVHPLSSSGSPGRAVSATLHGHNGIDF